jgi:hypothetical protein
MEQDLFAFTQQKVEDLLNASSSSAETIAAAQAWKDAVAADTGAADAATEKLLDAIDKHHATAEGTLAFAESDEGKQFLGEEAAAQLAAHQRERIAQGAKWCDCPACTATHELLRKFGREE